MNFARVNFTAVGYVKTDPRWTIQPHRHGNHEILVVLKGNHQNVIAGRRMTARCGDILYIPTEIVHAEKIDPKNPTEMVFIGWRSPRADHGFGDMIHDVEGRVRMLARWLCQEYDDAYPDHRSVQQGLLIALLAEMDALVRRKGQQGWVRTIRRFILDHLTEPIRLEDLAGHAGMGKFHFLRQYRRATGRTPMRDVRRIRAEAARDLVISTGLPLKAIAARVGISNEYYLHRVFRLVFRTTPGQLRQKPDKIP
jgi:AraC-like DNA-binding protein/mannose-6-phosphate isomerase-like protein (cupin superfamily)